MPARPVDVSDLVTSAAVGIPDGTPGLGDSPADGVVEVDPHRKIGHVEPGCG